MSDQLFDTGGEAPPSATPVPPADAPLAVRMRPRTLAEVGGVIDRAAHRRKARGEPTVFFLDEIHRFNKAQQDALLPAVEEGLVTLIGATTENPFFEVNSALISRVRVYELQPLEADDVEALLRRTGIEATDDALRFLAERADGDARVALGALEIAAEAGGTI